MRLLRAVIVALLSVFFLVQSPAKAVHQKKDRERSSELVPWTIDQAIAAARSQSMGKDPAWQRLLFYQRHPSFGRSKGVFDDSAFYLDPRGKFDPQAELEATLRALALMPPAKDPNSHAFCRYPRRRQWLASQFPGIASSWPRYSCPGFEQWWADRQYRAISIVFSSFYPDNPASMFGHIFLRLHRSQKVGQPTSELLDDVVNYAAFPDTSNPILYNLKGAFGGFPGRFSLLPYYMKVQEYNNIESRDLWEYELEASEDVLENLLLSLWELGPHHADYYYFDDNCSYILLMLLEAANPDWSFTDKLPVWATPTRGLRAVVEEPGLIRQLRYRPSALARYRERYRGLDSEQQVRLQLFLEQDLADVRLLASKDSPAMIDTALEWLDYREGLGGLKRPKLYADQRLQLLTSRRQIKQPTATLKRVPWQQDPRAATGEQWLMLGAGGFQNRPAAYTDWQPVLKDLLSPDLGYSRGMQIQIMPMSVLWQESGPLLQSFDILHILSLNPYGQGLSPRTWGFRLGWDRQAVCLGKAIDLCPKAELRAGRGASWRFPFGSGHQVTLSSLLNLGVGSEEPTTASSYALLGPEVIAHWGWSSDFKLLLRTRYTWHALPDGQLPGGSQSELSGAYNFGPATALRVGGRIDSRRAQVVGERWFVGTLWYF